MKKRRIIFASLTIFLLLLGAFESSRAGGDEDLRVMVYDPKGGTSKCIGDPKTPLCAAETLAFCGSWLIGEYCTKAGYPDFTQGSHGVLGYSRLKTKYYKVLDIRPLKPQDIPEAYRHEHNTKEGWQAGDVAVHILWKSCILENQCYTQSRDDPNQVPGEGCPRVDCMWYKSPQTYVVRKEADRWRVLFWGNDPELPPSFWKGG